MDKNIALSKAYFLILIRFALIVCCMVVLFVQRASSLPNLFAFYESKLMVIALLVNIIYILVARIFYSKVLIFLLIQTGVDVLFVTVLVYLSGGIISMYLTLFFGPILAVGMLVNASLGFVYASLSTIGIALIALMYFLAGIGNTRLPWVSDFLLYPFTEHDYHFLRSFLFAQGLSFHLVALFVYWLSNVMKRQRVMHDEILHNLTDGVIVIDNHCKILFINPTAKDFLDISVKDCVGKGIFDIILTNRYEDVVCALHKHFSTTRLYTDILYKNRKLPILLTINPFSTKKQISGKIIILRDISDQRRAEDALRRLQRLQTISEIAASIAHEIRNPLASIRGAIQELCNQYSEEDEKHILMSIALKESDRINGIISDFLQFSRTKPPNLQKICLNHTLEEFTFFLQKRPDMSGSQIHLTMEENLWLTADPEQLKQIFYNLAINALEASIGSLKLDIDVKKCSLKSALPQTSYSDYNGEIMGICMRFKDHGRGIPEEYKNKIFDPFFTTKSHGTGMGLAIVSKIMDMHQGFYSFYNDSTDGAVFTLWLPSMSL